MGLGRSMCWTQLWMLAILAFFSLTSLSDGSPLEVMSAPNLFRVGTAENIFVEIQDCTFEKNIVVSLSVMNHPTKSTKLASGSVTLTKENKYQALGQITIPDESFNKDRNLKQYVYLQAQFPDRILERVVLLSFQSSYFFIQTDKTIYTPSSHVQYRVFAVKPGMDGSATDSSITVDIVAPNNIIVQSNLVSATSGIYSGVHKLGEIVSTGLWKIVAKFESNSQQNFETEFEVKEYVLPSFEVKLMSDSNFFYVGSEELTVNIKARYLFNQEVNGVAYVVFGVMQGSQKISFPGSLQRAQIEHGSGVVKLKREHITQTFPNILELVGRSIFVAVSVLTESGGEMVEAELRNIQIVTSPYTILLKKSPKYFKPSMSFDVVAEVLNPDGTSAKNVAVVVDPDALPGNTVANGIARVPINKVGTSQPLTITVRTNDPLISNERQATATMVVLPYTTRSNIYIHIGVDAAEAVLGQNLKINFNFNQQGNQQKDITYLILSKGRLVTYGRYLWEGQVLFSLYLPVTKEMLPSFRIIAYYHPSGNEVVSDSVWVDVKDSCMGSLKLEAIGLYPSYEPRSNFDLRVTGDPGATVGLAVVDKGIYVLNNKHRLTQKKVWDIVEKHDTGCTPGGGKDSMGVFYDAGLVFETNTASGTPDRIDLKCPVPSRRKRASTIMEVRTSLVSQYKDELQRQCCLDGMKATLLSYTCDRRSEYIVDGPACVAAYLLCCKEMETQRAEQKVEDLQLARSEEDDSYEVDMNEIVSRTSFPESWLWIEIKLPSCPDNNPNCETTSVVKTEPLKDSITTWQFTGISLSRTHGICVADPLEVIVRKQFFIDLRLPYSVVRGEQVEIKAILHNYSPNAVTVRVDLLETPHVCSAASKRVRYRQEVSVGKETTRSVSFVIIPMREGQHRIEVKAAVKGSDYLRDGVLKLLQVVPEGVLLSSQKIITLDPTKKGVGDKKKQVEIINSEIPLTNLVPNSHPKTLLYLTGREHLSHLLENAISGNSMGTLIKQPSGCGEQNMIHMTLPVTAAMYLDQTNQWEAVGFKKRDEALQHIRTGLQNQLPFRKKDGSFAVQPDQQSSTWLTAYVAKVFSMANKLVEVKNNVICDAVKFLILKAQLPDGMFTEIGYVFSKAMIGDVEGADSDASLTAFCLIAMQESSGLCADVVSSMRTSKNKAVTYLKKRLPTLTHSYAVAMTSYALANEKILNKEILFKFASPDSSHWPVSLGNIYTVEATAYALLALIKANAFAEAQPVVKWFKEQQREGGGYGSTQATIMAYQAIAEYWASAPEPDYDLNVDISFPGRGVIDKYNFNMNNHFTTRTSKLKDINKDIKVTAEGSGEATLTMVSMYYTRPEEKESDCQKFNLSVQVSPDKLPVYKLRIDVLYKDETHNATMSILDIGLPTGFSVNIDDLNLLAKGRARTIAKYEMNTVLSERGSLIIYLDKVSNKQPEEITFRITKDLLGHVLQPAAVSVYEYYSSETQCVKFYNPERKSGELQRLCRNDECICAEENCSMQRKDKIDNSDRVKKACESTRTSIIDFVYKVRVDNFTEGLSTDIYTMHVVEVIKEGNDDVGPLNKHRTFLSYMHCRAALDLRTGKTYLVMGASKDIAKDQKRLTYQYVLGERTWIEYWPTQTECQSSEYWLTCRDIEAFVDVYKIFGCLDAQKK